MGVWGEEVKDMQALGIHRDKAIIGFDCQRFWRSTHMHLQMRKCFTLYLRALDKPPFRYVIN